MRSILLANLAPNDNKTNFNNKVNKELTTLHFPMGLGIIAQALKNARFKFDVYDAYVDGTKKGFYENVKDKKYNFILMNGFLGNFTYLFIQNISNEIKKLSPDSKIIIGGPIASTIPELLIRHNMADYVVQGEGEETIIDLLNTLTDHRNVSNVKGLYYKNKENKATFSGERERIRNLNIWPCYDVFPISKYIEYLKKTNRCWELSTSRGCYARCRFCKLAFGQKITNYSLESVMDHMKYILKNYDINRFNFVDDNFLNNTKRVNEFRELLLKEPYKFKWRFQGRADRITVDMVEKLKEVGLFDISFGIESGSQEMLNRYGKNLNIQKALSNLKAIKNLIEIHATFIVGGPGENWKTINETVEFIRETELNNAGIGILTLFPKTEFYDLAKKNRIIDKDEDYCAKLGPVYEYPYTNISDLSGSELMDAKKNLLATALKFGAYV